MKGESAKLLCEKMARLLQPFLPFLPRAVRARLNALDALERIQDEVANTLREPWPGPEAKAHAEVNSEFIVLCFKNGDGSTTRLGSLPVSDCL